MEAVMSVETSISRSAVRALAGLRDPLGVLSLYVDVRPPSAGARPGWRLEVENQIGSVREQVAATEPHGRRQAILGGLDELAPEIEAALDPRQSGRTRVLFAGIEWGERRRFHLQLPGPTRVLLEPSAFVRPLLELMRLGRSAGIVSVSRSEVTVLGWEFGAAEPVAAWSIEVDTSEWSELKGPAAPNPASAQQMASQHDRFQREVREEQVRAIVAHGAELEMLRDAHGWDVIVVAGDPRLAEPLAAELSGGDQSILIVDKELHGVPHHEVAGLLLPVIEAHRAQREREFVELLCDAALAGGHAALGPKDTLDALNDGRVTRLALEVDRHLAGVRAGDGRLFVDEEHAHARRAVRLAPEGHLGERMVERALETSAEVEPISGPAAEALAPYEGVGALLRWTA
jgi:hypothetical protein